jgi:hypothetical protein
LLHVLIGGGGGQRRPVREPDQPVEELLGRVHRIHDLSRTAPPLRRPLLEKTERVAVAVGHVVEPRLGERSSHGVDSSPDANRFSPATPGVADTEFQVEWT